MAGPARTRDDGPMTEESIERLDRSDEGRLITGVCAGLARHTGIDPVVFRVMFPLLMLAAGTGVWLYVLAFLLMAAPGGGPSRIERMSRRLFEGDTVLALLGAALAAATVLRVADAPTSGESLALVVVFALTMLVAHSRDVDLVQLARSMPERVKGRPLSLWNPPAAAPRPARDGMIDLALLVGRPVDDLPAPPSTYDPVPAMPRRRRSYLGTVTLLAAVATGAALSRVTGGRPELDRIQIVIAGALLVVATGLVLGAWFGRDRKLITIGAIMSLALALTSVSGDPGVAERIHRAIWRPAAAPADQTHKVFIGENLIDLTSMPLHSGQRIEVDAEVTVGVVDVRVPSTVRVEVDGQAFIGDITVDRQVTSGPRARVRRTLEPEGHAGKHPPTIVLRIRSKIGDMEVTRVPA